MLKYQNIAPAPTSATELCDTQMSKHLARASNVPYGVDQTHSVQRRNARERNRVKQVNNSFAKLRQHIPQTIIADLTKGGGRGPHKKISKVDTLRIAVEYIRRLQDLVDDLNSNCDSSSNSSNSDISSNSSFSSQSSSDSSIAAKAGTTATQIYNTLSKSPLPPFQQAHQHHQNLHQQQQQQTHLLLQHQQQQAIYSTALLTPVSLTAYSPSQSQLDAGCHSPTSSFNSSMSFDSGTFEPTAQQLSPQAADKPYLDANLQLKFEPYDNFALHEDECTPDDDEILDYISLWQEQ